MKTYEVILRRISYVTYSIEANSVDDAEALAWDELVVDHEADNGDADWSVESIEEETQT